MRRRPTPSGARLLAAYYIAAADYQDDPTDDLRQARAQAERAVERAGLAVKFGSAPSDFFRRTAANLLHDADRDESEARRLLEEALA
jgi:hypothetical protein